MLNRGRVCKSCAIIGALYKCALDAVVIRPDPVYVKSFPYDIVSQICAAPAAGPGDFYLYTAMHTGC